MRRLKVSGLDSSSVSLGMRNPQRGALISLSLSIHYMRDERRRQGKNIVVEGIDQDPSCDRVWGRRSWWRIDWFWVETFHFSVSFLLWISDTTMVILFKSCCGAQCFLLLFWSFSRQHSHTYAALAHLTVSTSSSFLSHCFRFHRKVSRTVDSKGPFAHGDGERGDRHRERERERATLSLVLYSPLKWELARAKCAT